MNYDMFTSNETTYIYFVILFWVKFEFVFTLFIQMGFWNGSPQDLLQHKLSNSPWLPSLECWWTAEDPVYTEREIKMNRVPLVSGVVSSSRSGSDALVRHLVKNNIDFILVRPSGQKHDSKLMPM